MARNNTGILPLSQKHICPFSTTNTDVITDDINTTDYRQLTLPEAVIHYHEVRPPVVFFEIIKCRVRVLV